MKIFFTIRYTVLVSHKKFKYLHKLREVVVLGFGGCCISTTISLPDVLHRRFID